MNEQRRVAGSLVHSPLNSGTHVNPSLIVGVIALLAWIALAFVFPVATGWIHLLLALGVVLLLRRVVTGRAAW